MCHWDRVEYICGCIKRTEFYQCAERGGSNVKCKPIIDGKPKETAHFCDKHLVWPTAPEKFYQDSEGRWISDRKGEDGEAQQEQQQQQS
ncbi:hypothetical protein GGS20DRAFT_494596 [Poronia punctata]|nr:hypothetical protein GGS20DRAFT_494596 [Poronia punctata]